MLPFLCEDGVAFDCFYVSGSGVHLSYLHPFKNAIGNDSLSFD